MSLLQRILLALLTVLASVLGVLAAWSVSHSLSQPRSANPSSASADQPRPVVPAFRLTERNGQTITPRELAGQVWIASFVFTRCSGTCPAVAATLARLQSELKDVPNFKLVTFTIDPDRDTPDELKKYAERWQADPERWWFLTGPEDEIHALANQSFKVLVKRNDNPKPGDEFDHATRLVLVNAVGEIVGYYDGLPPRTGGNESFEANLERLRSAVRSLASEATAPVR